MPWLVKVKGKISTTNYDKIPEGYLQKNWELGEDLFSNKTMTSVMQPKLYMHSFTFIKLRDLKRKLDRDNAANDLCTKYWLKGGEYFIEIRFCLNMKESFSTNQCQS